MNDKEKLCLIKTIRDDQVLINYLRFLMTFRTIKADNGKFMGFDILGGLSRESAEESDQAVGSKYQNVKRKPTKRFTV